MFYWCANRHLLWLYSELLKNIMASSATLLYESQQEVGGQTFYKLRLDLVPEAYEALINLLVFLIGAGLPNELSMLDLPFLIPSTIANGTSLQNYSGLGSFTLPETVYFAYVKGGPHINSMYGVDTPGELDIEIQQAFLAETEVWYSDIDPGSLSQWPSGDSPATNPPGNNGWNYPGLLASWGWVEDTDVAGRYLSPWFYTDVYLKNLMVWDGCTDWQSDEDHFLSNTPSQYLGNRYRYADPNFIYSCNEENTSWLYWVERETIGGVETISVWKFQSTQPAYYYPHLDFSDSVPTISPDVITLPALDLMNLLDIPVSEDILTGMRLSDVANLYAPRKNFPRGRSGSKPSGRSGSKPSGSIL